MKKGFLLFMLASSYATVAHCMQTNAIKDNKIIDFLYENIDAGYQLRQQHLLYNPNNPLTSEFFPIEATTQIPSSVAHLGPQPLKEWWSFAADNTFKVSWPTRIALTRGDITQELFEKLCTRFKLYTTTITIDRRFYTLNQCLFMLSGNHRNPDYQGEDLREQFFKELIEPGNIFIALNDERVSSIRGIAQILFAKKAISPQKSPASPQESLMQTMQAQGDLRALALQKLGEKLNSQFFCVDSKILLPDPYDRIQPQSLAQWWATIKENSTNPSFRALYWTTYLKLTKNTANAFLFDLLSTQFCLPRNTTTIDVKFPDLCMLIRALKAQDHGVNNLQKLFCTAFIETGKFKLRIQENVLTNNIHIDGILFTNEKPTE